MLAHKPLRRFLPRDPYLSGILALCVYLRLPPLTHPFWFNEVWRANLISCPDMLACLLKNDRGPVSIGIAYFTRPFVTLLPNIELTMRITTAITCMTIPYLAYLLGKALHSRTAGLVGALISTISFTYMDFMTQFNPYCVEVFFVLLTLLSLRSYANEKSTRALMATLGLVTVSIFFATTMVLVLPGIYLSLFWDLLKRKRILTSFYVGVHALALLIVFYLYYKWFIRPQASENLYIYWQDVLPKDFSFRGIASYIWKSVFDIFSSQVLPLKLNFKFLQFLKPYLPLAALGLYVFGCFKAARNYGGSVIFTINFTICVTIAAAFAQLWPFGANRTNFFIFAPLTCIASIGIAALWNSFQARARGWTEKFGVALAVFLGIAVFPVATFEAYGIPENSGGRYMAEFRRGVAYLKDNMRDGESIVVYHKMAQEGFKYYYDSYFYFEASRRIPHEGVQVTFDSEENETTIRSEAFLKTQEIDKKGIWLLYFGGMAKEDIDSTEEIARQLAGAAGETKSFGRLTLFHIPAAGVID